MRRWRAAIFLSLTIGNASAQDQAEKIFLPAMGGEYAKIIDLTTGDERPVLGTFSEAPKDCPTDAYWLKNEFNVVSCVSGVRYRLVPLGMTTGAYVDALKLKAVGGGTETDEHPPMKYPNEGGEVKP